MCVQLLCAVLGLSAEMSRARGRRASVPRCRRCGLEGKVLGLNKTVPATDEQARKAAWKSGAELPQQTHPDLSVL